MEDNKNLEQEQVETKEEVTQEQQEEQKQGNVEIANDETKEKVLENTNESKEESLEDNKYTELEQRLKALEEDKKKVDEALKEQTIKNTILEKISDKDLQKAVLETGLVRNADDIEKVLKIVEISKTKTKNFSDGYIPADQMKADAYQQAEKKGDIFTMIKQKMSKQ